MSYDLNSVGFTLCQRDRLKPRASDTCGISGADMEICVFVTIIGGSGIRQREVSHVEVV